jgi:hypothetical protein
MNLLDVMLSVRRCVEVSLNRKFKAIKPDWSRVNNCADFDALRRIGCARRRRRKQGRVFRVPDPEKASILVQKLERQLFLMSPKK